MRKCLSKNDRRRLNLNGFRFVLIPSFLFLHEQSSTSSIISFSFHHSFLMLNRLVFFSTVPEFRRGTKKLLRLAKSLLFDFWHVVKKKKKIFFLSTHACVIFFNNDPPYNNTHRITRLNFTRKKRGFWKGARGKIK